MGGVPAFGYGAQQSRLRLGALGFARLGGLRLCFELRFSPFKCLQKFVALVVERHDLPDPIGECGGFFKSLQLCGANVRNRTLFD